MRAAGDPRSRSTPSARVRQAMAESIEAFACSAIPLARSMCAPANRPRRALSACAESTAGLRVRIHSGHWGTGAFGGNRVLMAAAQILAARCAGISELVYHSLDDDGVAAFDKGVRIASDVPEGATLADMVALLDARGFSWGTSDGN